IATTRRQRQVAVSSEHEMAETVKLITRIGPNVNEIARRTGIHKESVRYRYKSFILRGGRRIHAIIDREALGLRQIVVRTRFGMPYKSHAHKILAEIYRCCYLAGYDKELVGDRYIMIFDVPAEHIAHFKEVLLNLEEIGILEGVRIFDCGYWKLARTKVELYDFKRDEWKFDWTSPRTLDSTTQPRPTKSKVDDIDLLLLKELKKDADRSLTEIGKAIAEVEHIRINSRTLDYHYNRHVKRQRLVNGYAIGWPNTHSTDSHRKANPMLMEVMVVVGGLSREESTKIQALTKPLPFLWGEALGEDYYGKFVFPVEIVNDAMAYLGKMLNDFGDRGSIFLGDQSKSVSSFPFHELIDPAEKTWRFDKGNVLSLFQVVALELKDERLVLNPSPSPSSTDLWPREPAFRPLTHV
ncbi:MAG: hypothetical protein ACRD6W_18150, partial [Nitrososphaerales archaeon]